MPSILPRMLVCRAKGHCSYVDEAEAAERLLRAGVGQSRCPICGKFRWPHELCEEALTAIRRIAEGREGREEKGRKRGR